MSKRANRLSRSIWCLSVLCGCAAGPHDMMSGAGDAGAQPEDLAELRSADQFWQETALCGVAAEEYPNILDAADSTDAVVLGHFVDVAAGNVLAHGDVDEYYAEANLTIEVDEELRNDVSSKIVVSFVLTRPTADSLDEILNKMRNHLPKEELLLLLHKRMDILEMPGLYRIDSPLMGLWTKTTRSPIDNPIADDRCLDHYGPEVQQRYLNGADSVSALASMLRG